MYGRSSITATPQAAAAASSPCTGEPRGSCEGQHIFRISGFLSRGNGNPSGRSGGQLPLRRGARGNTRRRSGTKKGFPAVNRWEPFSSISGSGFSVIVKIHPHTRAADEHIAQHAERIRHVPKDEETQSRRKDHLRIVIDRDLLGRRAEVGFGDAQLPHAGERARENQADELESGHGPERKDQKRQAGQTGKRRKIEHDALAVLLPRAQLAHKGIGRARAHAADSPGKRGKRRWVAEARLDDAHAARKGHQHAQHLHPARLLLQQKDGKQDRKERRELVEHVRIGEIELPDGIEIAQQPHRAAEAAPEQRGDIPLFRPKRNLLPPHHRQYEQQRDEIAEERLLEGGQIAGELDKHGHHRKPERGDDDIQNALGLLTQSRHGILQLLFLHSGRRVPMASALKVRLYYTTTASFVESRR